MTLAALLPPDGSADGWRIDQLLHTTGVLTAALAALLVGFLVVAALRWRDRGGPARAAPARRVGWRAALVPLAITTVVFVAVDGNLLVTSLVDARGVFLATDGAERDPRAVRVEVNAQQWVWSLRHAGRDGRFATDDDVVTTGDLRVPVGRPVILQIASSDVVHSLFVPGLRLKIDAVPGRIATTWFRPVATGAHEMACTQHCGVHHHLMRGVVTVMEEADFERWIDRASADALAIAAEDARARAEEPTRERPIEVAPGADPADARRWGWPWRERGGQ